VLRLAYREGLSDERAMDAIRFDLRWKVALDLPPRPSGLPPDEPGALSPRLLLHGKEGLVFDRSLELAGELGLLEGEAEEIVDSTPMLGAAAVQDTAIGALGGPTAPRRGRGQRRSGGEELRSGLRFDYSRPREEPKGDWHD
jgi:hypothetical protein